MKVGASEEKRIRGGVRRSRAYVCLEIGDVQGLHDPLKLF